MAYRVSHIAYRLSPIVYCKGGERAISDRPEITKGVVVMRRDVKLFFLIGLLALSLLGCNLLALPKLLKQPTATPVPTPKPVRVEVAVTPTPLPPVAVQEIDAEEQLLINVYKRVNPAVVNIRVVKRMQGFGFEFEMPGFSQGPEEFFMPGEGSGFVYDEEGHIVTNNHVVEGAEEIDVTFSDGTIVEAEVIGTDPDSDLAVLKVDLPPEGLQAIELGDSDRLEVGQRVIAIGNPFGLKGTMTTGIISALGRTLPLGRISTTIGGRFSIPELIQTDAAINPGNSGGPLLDSQGRIIGVNTAITSPSGSFAGVGFAVPVNLVKRVVPELIEEGRYAYPWLGITGTSLVPKVAEAMDLPVESGALVIEVVKGGPAEGVDLRGGDKNRTIEVAGQEVPLGGDVIVAIDGVEVKNMEDLIVYLVRETRVGQEVKLTIVRDGEEMEVEVKLAERPRE